ncbi:hypothetical protein DERP_009806 [Dermatophagoides pteronyssinus]|uniref:Uncharacterized protein n=1 Tax=Dermatophagoides pteronyssinus TaxID=6956 RepID=A0ABQ8IRB7_DERPT|nr:hypothetical protein DERP_009806 [Dermatophagoides pteronyssinus]
MLNVHIICMAKLDMIAINEPDGIDFVGRSKSEPILTPAITPIVAGKNIPIVSNNCLHCNHNVINDIAPPIREPSTVAIKICMFARAETVCRVYSGSK